METYLNLAIEGQDITEHNQTPTHTHTQKKTTFETMSPPTKKQNDIKSFPMRFQRKLVYHKIFMSDLSFCACSMRVTAACKGSIKGSKEMLSVAGGKSSKVTVANSESKQVLGNSQYNPRKAW